MANKLFEVLPAPKTIIIQDESGNKQEWENPEYERLMKIQGNPRRYLDKSGKLVLKPRKGYGIGHKGAE